MYAPTHTPQSLSANMADAALNRTNFGTPGLISSEIDSPFTRENDIFSPIVQDELSDEPAMRLKGLRAYVTSDMKPDRQRESDRIFGRTLPFKSEFETNWRVGRALASATGYRDNPAAFYADPRFKSMGYQLPAHWDDVMQLYADLGAQFANKERTALQEQITKEQALVAERTKDPNALSQAIYKAVTRKHISTDDALILEYSGITADSLRKVNAALNLIQDNFSTAAKKDGSFSTSDKADTLEVTQADFQGKQIAGLTEAESGIPSFISNIPGVALGEKIWQEYTANQQTDSLADFFGEDHVARGIFLELVRMAGAQQRYSEQGDSLTEQTANSLKAAGTAFYNASLKRWINALIQNRAFSAPAPQGVDATLANSRRNAMHNDLLAAFDAGYSKQSDELAADSSWLFNAARIPVSVADIACSTAGWLSAYTLPIELAATLNENINTAESNIYSTDATEMQASFWERYGIAATQTAAAGISVYGVGKLMQGAGVLGQRYAPEVTRRVLGSRTLTYAANVTESTVSESLEELAQVGVQELMEGLGAVADRQKQDSLKRLRDTFTSPEYWSATVGFGLIAGIAGYRGSRSKYPYKFEQTLRELGFSKKESAALGNQVSDMVASGAKPEEISNLLSGKIYERILADPEKTTRKMLETAHAYAQELRMQDFAAHGVRDTLIEQAGLKNLTRNADGSVSFITTEKGEDGIPKDVEKQMSAEDFNRWLITSASQEITARVLETQALIRGEHLAQAAFNKQSEGKTPFARIAFLHDAPAEVLAQLRGSDTFNRKTLTLLGNYAVSEINRRMAAGESRAQAASAEFGSTGIPLGSIARTASDYDKRVSIAIQKGEIQSEKDAESASFMLAGRTTGDTILFLARGELEARDVAHEWMEGFARSRYFSDPESWRSRLDALDAELNARGYTRNSIFGNTPQNERTDLDYIEALTDIAQKHWLINADALNLTDNAKHLFGEILDDIGAIQNGLAFARELSNFINSAEGQAALGDSGALAKLMDETGTHLTDLIKEADKSVPRTAADFIQAHRDRVHTQVVSLADAKPATATPPPPDAELPESVLGVKGITQRDIQYANIFTEEGTLTTPPLTAYASVTAPKGAGRGLIGGQAYKMPNRTIEGTARLSDLSLPKSMADADWPTLAALAATNPDADSPVCVYRHKSGKLELIGGIPAYARAKAAGQPIVHVRVYDPNDRHTRAWANNFSRAERIRSGAASVAETIAHIQTNKLSRTQARKANLIPRDANGQELPSSRAAWLLLNHASAQTISHLKSGTITTREALETIADKVETTNVEEDALRTASFNIRKTRRRYSGVFSIANEPLYKALLETSRDFYKQYNNLLHAGGKNPSSILQAAAKALALKNAIYNVLPKDSQPWKAINDLSAKLQSLTEAARNPSADLPNNTPGLLPNEIQRYNELREDKHERSAFLQTRLSNLTGQLLRSTRKSLEAYLCRKLIDSAEQAYQTLQPKLQPSGKERRGITDTATFNKAAILHDMMFWSAERTAQEIQIEQANREAEDATESDVADAEQRLAEIALFGNLHEAGYEQTQKAVAQFIELIETGRARWEEVITAERRETRLRQEALAKVKPQVNKTISDKKYAEADGILGLIKNGVEGFMNPTQLLSTFTGIKGGFGNIAETWRNNLAQALDTTTLSMQKAQLDSEAALDAILGVSHLSSLQRDIARADFIIKTNQRGDTGATLAGRINSSRYRFTKEEIEHFDELRKSGQRQAFLNAINAIIDRPGASVDKEAARKGTLPHDKALDLALERIADENYQGGDVYITVEEDRGTDTAVKLELTPQQAANIVLLAEQPSYQNKYDEEGNLIERGTLDAAGYTDSVIEALEAYAGAELMEYARWKRDYLNTTGLFEAYEKYMGIPFPKEENYWPGAFDSPNDISNLNALSADYQGGGVYQMLIKRKKHTFDPKTTVSIDDAWKHALTMHYSYINLSPITREIRAFLRDPNTKNRIAAIAGKHVVPLLQASLNMLDAMPAVQNVADTALTKLAGRSFGARARTVLSGATTTIFKNFTSIINATVNPDTNLFTLIPEIVSSAIGKGGPMTVAGIYKLDSFKIRHNRESLTRTAQRKSESEKQSVLAITGIWGKTAIEKVDAFGNALSMAALYNREYKAARHAMHAEGSQTLSAEQDAEAHRIAENAVSVALHQNAQPLEIYDKAMALQLKTASLSAMAFMKSESFIKLGAIAMSAKQELNQIPLAATKAEKRAFYRRAFHKAFRVCLAGSMANQGVLALIAMLTDAAPDMDEDEFLPWFIGNIIAGVCGIGYFSALPYLGGFMSQLTQAPIRALAELTGADPKKVPGIATFEDTGMQLITTRDVDNFLRLLSDTDKPGTLATRWANSLRILGTLTGAASQRSWGMTITSEILLGFNFVLNALRPIYTNLKNNEKQSGKRKKKPTTTREEIHRQLGIQ